MKAFRLVVTTKSPFSDSVINTETIECDSLLELTSKIPFVIQNTSEKLKDYKDRHSISDNDDIPF